MKIGVVVPFSWSFWGAVVEHAELQAAALEARGHDVPAGDGERPARAVHPSAPPPGREARRPSGERDPRRAVRDRPRERLAAEHRAQPPLDLPDPPRPRARAVRRAPPARADDPGDLHRGPRARADADRRDAPRLGRPRLDAARHARVGLPDGSRRPADRGVRARPRVRGRVARRRLRDRPERRAPARAGRPRRPRAHDRVRRPARAAKGPPRPSPRVARDPSPNGRAARRRGRRSARRAPPPDPRRRSRPTGSTSSAS